MGVEVRGYLRKPYASTLLAGGGHKPSPSFSRSLGTNSPQLEPPKALPSTGRVGLIAEYALEGDQASGVLSEGVLCIPSQTVEAAIR